MTQPMLVVYATKRESTHEVADAVGARLRELGHEVDVRPAAEVGTLSPYGAVVIGGALYMGRWHHDARHFLSGHRDALTHLPVAVFAMGPRTTEEADIEAVAQAARRRPRQGAAARTGLRRDLRRRDRPDQAALPVPQDGRDRRARLGRHPRWADAVAELFTARAAA